MRKYILIATLLFACSQFSFTQSPIKLLKTLPTLKGKERIDCMIEIAKHYRLGNGYSGWGSDSSFYYDSLIYNEATRLGYKRGVALSLLRWNPGTDTLRLQNVKKAIQIGEELNDDEVLGWAYDALQILLFGASPKYFAQQIELLKKSVYHFQKARDTLGEALVSHRLCLECHDAEGIDFCKKSIQLTQQFRTRADWQEFGQFIYIRSLDGMCSYFEQAGDYRTALSYMRLAHQAARDSKDSWGLEDGLSRLFNKLGQYDSSLYYLLERGKRVDEPYQRTILGETYFLLKDYDRAKRLFQDALDSTRDKYKRTWYSHRGALLGNSKCLEIRKDYKTALINAIEGSNIAQLIDNPDYSMDIYALLSRLYNHLGKNDSAYHYLQQYTILKDSVTNKQYLWKLNIKLYEYKKEAEAARKEARLGFLDRDNKLKEQKLKQQAFLKNSLLIGILLLFLLGIFIFRSLFLKRKNEKLASEKTKAELQQKVATLEMQALRAQMNPHFIFNCLSSINRFILKNEPDAASDYLTRFSRLIRMVLMNSQKSLITLEDELEMLTIYLDMERLRFKNNFDYHIVFTNRVEPGAIFIPPLLLQPFCENAIWHGLKHLTDPQSGRREHGRLDIELTMNDKVLNCIITDNGIGRQKAAEIKSKSAVEKKSFGLKITTERLALLNGEEGPHTFYEIEDLKDENGNAVGTKVVLKITYRESVEEIA